jgi:acyl homoserine lactone synthase
MQVVAISSPRTTSEKRLLEAHHRLRARVFSERLGWDVDVVDGCETDRFDSLNPTYIMAIAEGGVVVGCARLLPAIGPTMASEIFPTLLPDRHLDAHSGTIESSRFCVDRPSGEGRGNAVVHEATLTMFAGIIEWSLANGYSEIVTVTDLRFERLLAQVGWPFHRLAEPRTIGVTNAVAGILPATEEMFFRLRPDAYRSDFQSFGRAA